MKPSVRSDGFLGLRLVIPVTQHGGVRPGAELPGSPPGDDLAVIVNDLNLRVICRVTDGLSSELDGVLGEGLKCCRACLRHTEGNLQRNTSRVARLHSSGIASASLKYAADGKIRKTQSQPYQFVRR